MNINRDYLIINDVKKSNVKLDNGSMFFYITDKNTQNIFVNLVINVSDNELIQKYANIENAEDYTLTMNIVKPDNDCKIIEGRLHDKEKAIFEFNLPEDCVDKIGSYKCELLTKCTINSREEITTSNKLTYKVKSSVLNDLDDIVEAPEYPLVIQLFDKLSDIDQYEEDRRAAELARQLAEQQRQTRFNALEADMTDSIQTMDDKVVEVENRITAKEQAVDTLIADTKADIDDYKVAKDQEIDDYKTAKDTEINEAITAQDNKIDTAINAQNDRITVVENNDTTQNNRLNVLENKDTIHESRMTAIEAKNVEQDNKLNGIEAIDVAQNSRLDAIETKNQQQDDRLLDIEKVNKRQDMNLKCLFAESKNNMIDVTEQGNSIYLQNSTVGYTLIDEIKGNTLVNCNKEPNKELILNGNINTSGDNTVTITEGVDGGLVDVALEGNTLVNVSETKDSTAITKAYTVENSGNHIALQGDIDGSCRPVIAGNTLVNLMPNIDTSTPNTNGETYLNYYNKVFNLLQNNKTYTFKVFNNPCLTKFYISDLGLSWIPLSSENSCTFSINQETFDNTTPRNFQFETTRQLTQQELDNLKFMILEGDYTNKPISDYFTGLHSSFEGNLVTQEMVDSGEEEESNLGKYRVDYKVTGKNKYKGKLEQGHWDLSSLSKYDNTGICRMTEVFECKPDTVYVLSGSAINFYAGNLAFYDKDMKYLGDKNQIFNFKTFTTPNNAYYFVFHLQKSFVSDVNGTLQIEEGDTATSYEPYKEYTKTLYLNSPLLEGDTIEEKDGGIYHVHRSELVAYTEGDETSLITDKVNTLHQLETPTYELIEQSNLAIPSYGNGHLDFNTAVPVEKVDFLPFSEELTYLYANTQYTVQFVSDKAITADITLGGTSLLAQSIVAGLNRITITTPATLVDNKLIISGVGANISEVVVTDTDREFGYFEGIKSVGEGGNLVITSNNRDNTLSNTQQLTHEPLRAVGDYRDKYAMINGKWYIERNCKEVVLDGSDDEKWNYFSIEGNTWVFSCSVNYFGYADRRYYPLPNDRLYTSKVYNYNKEMMYGGDYANGKIWVHLFSESFGATKSTSSTNGLTLFKQYLSENPITVVGQLMTPTYEPIDYNPLEVYSGTTHITTNSVIPCNITVKNHGFNCLLKPSTTYTVSSNLGLNTVTTPSTLTEDCLRFMDTDTSDVTTMRDVLVLEGDWTSKADLIPANFSGIESAFEQEYDAEKGKYKVNAKVVNEDKTKENNIAFYINEPLRGMGDVKDKVFIKDDKVVVERNCGVRAYEDGDFGTYPTDKVNTVYQLAEPVYEEVEYNDTKLFIESFKNSTLFYNSNVPVTSKLYYSYSVPIVDTVAQTADISNQQDSMIIDLATQVAVMEMMLM